MEPLDTTKNVEGSGFSKRRISSILKAPRKSTRFPDPVQQENVVECAKPAEKRNSRRVSFAAANDVLLFSKDVKNASPTRSHLQELITATAANTQNRVQVAVTDDGSQIMGMENLLNAPLHASQSNKVNFDTGNNFGERTVMFSTEDAFMDMTHSHTLNIAADAELLGDISLENYDILPTDGEKRVTLTVDDGSRYMTLSDSVHTVSGTVLLPTGRNTDLSVEKRDISPSVPCLDLGFENFLASLSKARGPNTNAVITRTTPPAGPSSEETSSSQTQIKTQTADVDKENQVPTSVSALMEKSLSSTRKTGESSYGGTFCPEDDVNMDRTEAQTGRILGVHDDDPFHCLFPTQDMYTHSDKRVSQTAEMMKTKQHQSRKSLRSTDPKDRTSLIKPPLHASHQRHQVSSNAKGECKEKTVMFTADGEFMDMTQSHTVNIVSGPSDPEQMSENSFDPGFKNFLASLSKPGDLSGNPAIAKMKPTAAPSSNEIVNTNASQSQLRTPRGDFGNENQPLDTNRSFGESFNRSTICPKDDISMDMTQTQTGHILGGDVSMDMTEAQTGCIMGLIQSDDPFQFLFPSQDMYPHPESLKTAGQQSSEAAGPSNHKGTETSLKPSLKTKMQIYQDKLDSDDDYREKTVRFSADVACMDMTRSHTVNIATDLKLQSHQNLDVLPTRGETTVRFTADDAAMNQEGETCGPPRNRSSAAHSLNPGVNNVLTTKPSDPSVNPAIARMIPAGRSSDGGAICREDDISMDMTEAQTDCIIEIPGRDEPHQSGNLKKSEMTPRQQSSEETGLSHYKGLESSLKTSLKATIQRPQVKFDAEDDFREKTVRFTADDACMDVTRSHTVNIATDFKLQPHQHVDLLPAHGEKTVRFTANEAAMDVTRSHTVNIATDFKLQPNQNVDLLPANEDKTVRFTANEAAMDVTRSHTVNIATDFQPKSYQNVDFIPTCGEKAVIFTPNEAAMGMTQCVTVNTASDLASDSVRPIHENVTSVAKKREGEACGLHRKRSSSAYGSHQEFNTLSEISGHWANLKAETTDAPFLQETSDSIDSVVQLNTLKPTTNAEDETPGLVSALMEKPVNKTATGSPENSACMDMTEAQTGYILGQTCTDEPLQCLSSTQDPSETLGTSNPEGVKITNLPDCLDWNETDIRKEPEPRTVTCPVQQMIESSPGAVDQHVDALRSQKSRIMSLADLQSKIRRLSNMINAAPDAITTDSCTAPVDSDLNINSQDKTTSLLVMEPEPELDLTNAEDNTQAQCLTEAEQPSASATPFSLKTKQLMSRLSVGGFKPKLPQRSKLDNSKKTNPLGEHTRTITVNVSNQLSSFDSDVSDIYDEELESYEDMSEMLDTRSPQKICKSSSTQELNMVESVEDDVFEDFISTVHGQKRSFQDDDNNEDEKRMKASTETVEMALQSDVLELDSNITTTRMTARTIDSSDTSHMTSMRCEAASESTFKHSVFESQFEDYASDVPKKLEDGTITVLEFFKLFNIDFVIHNPRQSVIPGRLSSDINVTPLDLLKDRHISRPKQTVYEANVLNLTEKVEGLKVRKQDLDKPLKTVNRALWEEMRYSSEEELKSFGAKLKEKNNLFRKTSKVESHKMKEVLYSDLVQAHLEEQQKLRGKLEKADEMIKSLDECICDVETELAAVDEKGFENKQSLKSLQEEMKKVTEALAANDRQIAELEVQKKQNSSQLNRLRAETGKLENHLVMLNMLNEWKFKERQDNCTVYTFLYETMHLELVYEKPKGNDVDSGSEQKIAHITFKFDLDDEKSQCSARLVHKLVSQYIEGESAWVEKYPTSRHVPALLHDVSLVASRCRLLGEELRLLKMWGGLRLDILDICCVDTQVRIVFSSLKTLSKFEVVFAVSLTNHLYVLQVESFKNIIGGTTIQQVEEIVASFSPAKNLLTKIVKKIHSALLC